MASNRTVYHVVPNASADAWVVSQESGGFKQEFATEEYAVKIANRMARKQEPSQMKVHKQDGNMEYESTYGDDPQRSPS